MFGMLAKLAGGHGSGSPDEMAMLLKALGIKIEMEAVTLADAPAALRGAAVAAGSPGASLHRLNGSMKDGSTLVAFIVMVPSQEKPKSTGVLSLKTV
jgi:hypothetical protein